MPFTIKTKIDGLKPLLARLDGLKKSVQKSVIKKAVDAASKVVLDAIKPLVPKDTGLLARSMGRKVFVGRRTGVVLAIIGPRTGFKIVRSEDRTARTTTSITAGTADRISRKTGKLIKGRPSRKIILSRRGTRSAVGSNPTQYAHLVESGRKGFGPKKAGVRALSVQGVGWRASVGPAAGVHFMERGLGSARPQIVSAMTREIMAGLAKAGR